MQTLLIIETDTAPDFKRRTAVDIGWRQKNGGIVHFFFFFNSAAPHSCDEDVSLEVTLVRLKSY